jgi:hypothetical protein
LTDAPSQFPPNHPVTRLGRVIQQLRSFADLHAGELEGLGVELDNAGAAELAARLRAYRDVQRDEATMVVDELVDLQQDMSAATPAPLDVPTGDPAANSPRRAKWLAEQEAEAERLRQPISRRELFDRVANPGDENSDT